MANNKTDVWETAVLNVCRLSTLTGITAYVSVFFTNPGETGIITGEPAGSGFARQLAGFAAPAQVAGNAQMQNAAQINFPVATSDYSGVVSYVGIMDTVTTGIGTMVYFATLSVGKTILNGDQLIINAGSLTIAES